MHGVNYARNKFIFDISGYLIFMIELWIYEEDSEYIWYSSLGSIFGSSKIWMHADKATCFWSKLTMIDWTMFVLWEFLANTS